MQLGALVADANGKTHVRGVAYRPRDWMLQPVDWRMLAAGSKAKEHKMSAQPKRCGLWESLTAMGFIYIFAV